MKEQTTLQSTIARDETNLLVKDASVFSDLPFYIVLDRSTTDMEIMKVSSVSQNRLIVSRAQGNTVARSHAKGTVVYPYYPRIATVPPKGKSEVENLYVDPSTAKLTVEYEDTPVE